MGSGGKEFSSHIWLCNTYSQHSYFCPPVPTQISSLCQAHTQNLGYKVHKIRLWCKPEQAELTDWSWHLIYQSRTNGLVCQNLQPLEVVATSLLFMSSLFQVGPSRQDSSTLGKASIEKKMFSFGHCPNDGGGGLPMPEFFGPLINPSHKSQLSRAINNIFCALVF